MTYREIIDILTPEEKELNQILNDWDPIGIFPELGGPDDEYECFIDPIMWILNSHKETDELLKFLNAHLIEHMGIVNTPHNNVENFANIVLDWWNKKSVQY